MVYLRDGADKPQITALYMSYIFGNPSHALIIYQSRPSSSFLLSAFLFMLSQPLPVVVADMLHLHGW